MRTISHRPRQTGLDTLRGLALISMMAYHACWDLVYLFGMDWAWYRSFGAYLWQQTTCWIFVLLSGYCFHLGRRPLRRGLLAFGCGILVSVVTLVAMPDSPALWGVLTLLGGAMILTAPLDTLLRRVPPQAGIAISFLLFFLFRDVNAGYLGFEGARLAALPDTLYRNIFTAWLGFPPASFRSSDYFSLLPWLFLFWTGYFLYRLRREDRIFRLPRFPLVTALGRHSLLAYLIHQPLIYGLLTGLRLLGIL